MCENGFSFLVAADVTLSSHPEGSVISHSLHFIKNKLDFK
jgi:hypothetical protein